jgi:amidase
LRRAVLDISALTGRQPSDGTLEPHVLAAYHAGEAMSAADLQEAISGLNIASRAYGAFFERYDVMVTPTGAMEPFKIGRFGSMDTTHYRDWYVNFFVAHCPFTATVNMAGIPAMSVPLAHSKSGLPIGSHFIAALGQEPLLFRLAAQLESARPWFDRVPPIHVSRRRVAGD